MLTYFADYDRPTDTGPEYVRKDAASKREACAIARSASQLFGSAYVVAVEGDRQVGHIPYFDGVRDVAGIDGKV